LILTWASSPLASEKDSTYRPGKRSPDWLKIKSRPQQEFVVCGFTEGKGSHKHFGALLLAEKPVGLVVTEKG
jgi:bifunctional non-homologous end joining protein LigD